MEVSIFTFCRHLVALISAMTVEAGLMERKPERPDIGFPDRERGRNGGIVHNPRIKTDAGVAGNIDRNFGSVAVL